MNYTAFLRGINVGGRIIKMADLKICFEKMDFTNIITVLQTGNVIFESSLSLEKTTQTIEEGLTKTFSYPAKVLVRESKSLEKIIKKYPFKTDDPTYHHYIIFLSSPITKELLEQFKSEQELEKLASGDECLYWKVEKGMTLKSPFAKILSTSKYKDFNTVRNINTLNKIIAKH